MSLFVDLTPVSPHATNQALDFLFKATQDSDPGMWGPHESVLIRRLVELFSERGLDRLAHVKKEIIAWGKGLNHNPEAAKPVNMPGMMARWDKAEQDLVRLYLQSLPPGQWTLDDHMLSVDYVVQRYLPADELRTEAQWMATRASLMGKVQANMDHHATLEEADKILMALPSTQAAAMQQFTLAEAEQSALMFGNARAAENVSAVTENVRHTLRNSIMQHLQNQTTKAPGEPGEALETALLDQFADMNRDWRRLAVTEAGECQTQGFIASLPAGTKVKRIEQYATACKFCKAIDGRIATVVDADAPDKDGETQIWVGKNNIGRSASPRKRVGDELVPRSPDEMYWLPAGLAHPNCRGRWVHTLESQPGDDPDFAAWLSATLG